MTNAPIFKTLELDTYYNVPQQESLTSGYGTPLPIYASAPTPTLMLSRKGALPECLLLDPQTTPPEMRDAITNFVKFLLQDAHEEAGLQVIGVGRSIPLQALPFIRPAPMVTGPQPINRAWHQGPTHYAGHMPPTPESVFVFLTNQENRDVIIADVIGLFFADFSKEIVKADIENTDSTTGWV